MSWKGGWVGKILVVDLSKKSYSNMELTKELARDWIGGRGWAIKWLYENIKPKTDPLSPMNDLVIATGPLTGLLVPSSGKVVIAAKSPLTNGYGDGNIGSHFGYQLKQSGYDAVIIRGKAKTPVYLYITPNGVEFRSAEHIWGKGVFETEYIIRRETEKEAGTLIIGPGGENLVKFATVMSEHGRAGGRTGMGAVFGSKNLKAVVAYGWKTIPVADPDGLLELYWESKLRIIKAEGYKKWIDQGTVMTVEWCQEVGTFPTFNFSEGVFDDAYKIGGEAMVKEYKYLRKGCMSCPMPCGNVLISKSEKWRGFVEMDYENVALLGSNLGIGDYNVVIVLNQYADDMGVDTISLGNVMGFAMECYEKGLITNKDTKGLELKFGNAEAALKLAEMIVKREGIGDLLAEGVRAASEKIGKGAQKIAVHVKGLEVSGYDCHGAPAMALAYGTSEIGAHHKSAWVIAWEMRYGREKVDKAKPDKVIEFQRIRGGMFEMLTTCRLPWIELGYPLDYYPKFLKVATGLDFTLDQIYTIADKVYALIRAFWIREYGHWKREYDYPPSKWFETAPTKGPSAGMKLSKEVYDNLLDMYYEARGWDKNGIPRKSTLKKYGLDYVIEDLEKIGITLSE